MTEVILHENLIKNIAFGDENDDFKEAEKN